MKIEEAVTQAMTSEDFKTMEFRVDQKMAQILFRDKLYTAEGRLRVIAQEYMANARDAHRSAGKSDTPIDVTLPTQLSPEFIVRDYGNGISPKDVEEIFVVYGASTKKGSNDQNGGYGIGAKCAFSYVHAFAVTTTVKGVRYIYSAHIDSNNMNQFTLMDTGPATGPDGTEIRIPVVQADHTKLRDWVLTVSQAWTPRPNLINANRSYNDFTVEQSGSHWDLIDGKSPYAYGWYSHYGIVATVDDIPYDFNTIQAKAVSEQCEKLQELMEKHQQSLIIKFKIGDVTIPPQRETLDFTQKTKDAVQRVVDDFMKVMLDQAAAKLAACTSLADKITLVFDPSFDVLLGSEFGGGTVKDGGFEVEVQPEDLGVCVYRCKRKDSKLTRWEEVDLITIARLLKPKDTSNFYIDGNGKKLSRETIRPCLHNKYASSDNSRTQIVVFTDLAKMAAAGITPLDFRDLDATQLVRAPRGTPGSGSESGYIFAPSLSIDVSSYGNATTCEVEFKKTYANAGWIKSHVFVNTAQKVQRGCAKVLFPAVEFLDTTVSLQQMCDLYTTSCMLKHVGCLPSYSNANQKVYAWDDRYTRFMDPGDPEPVMFEDQIDDIVTKTLKLGVQDLLKLAMKGMGTYTIRSHWPCITPGADSGLKLVAALPDGVFSDKFKCLAKIACKFEQGDYKKHDQFVSSIPTFEKICGTEVTKAVQKAIDELVTVRDEIEALFKNYPSVEWLLPLVTKGHTINSRKNGQDCTMNFETTLSDYLKTAAPTNPAFKA